MTMADHLYTDRVTRCPDRGGLGHHLWDKVGCAAKQTHPGVRSDSSRAPPVGDHYRLRFPEGPLPRVLIPLVF